MGTTWSQDHKETVVWMQPGKNYYDNTCAQKKKNKMGHSTKEQTHLKYSDHLASCWNKEIQRCKVKRLGGRALVALVLGSTHTDCWPFHFPLFLLI